MDERSAVLRAVGLNLFMTAASGNAADFCSLWVCDPGISPLTDEQWPRMYKLLFESKRTCRCCGGKAWHTGAAEILPGYFGVATWKCGNCDERGLESYVCLN